MAFVMISYSLCSCTFLRPWFDLKSIFFLNFLGNFCLLKDFHIVIWTKLSFEFSIVFIISIYKVILQHGIIEHYSQSPQSCIQHHLPIQVISDVTLRYLLFFTCFNFFSTTIQCVKIKPHFFCSSLFPANSLSLPSSPPVVS